MELPLAFASDGEQIIAVLHVPEHRPAPGIIMCHGFTGNKAESHRIFVNMARELRDHGIAALRFDFRGSGDSAGEFREMTVSREIADAQAAFDLLASRSEVDASRLGVLGLSLGGCVAACLAGQEPRVKALALWSASAHPERIGQRVAADFGDKDVIDYQGWGLGRGFVDDVPNARPLERARGYQGPSLVVHGTADESVPVSDAREFSDVLGEQCRLHTIQGASHVFNSLAWKSEAIRVTREFFVEALSAA